MLIPSLRRVTAAAALWLLMVLSSFAAGCLSTDLALETATAAGAEVTVLDATATRRATTIYAIAPPRSAPPASERALLLRFGHDGLLVLFIGPDAQICHLLDIPASHARAALAHILGEEI
jgi:hypothetical protein